MNFKNSKRVLAFMLSLLMVLTMFPSNLAMAAEVMPEEIAEASLDAKDVSEPTLLDEAEASEITDEISEAAFEGEAVEEKEEEKEPVADTDEVKTATATLKLTINGEEYEAENYGSYFQVNYDEPIEYGEGLKVSLNPDDFIDDEYSSVTCEWKRNGVVIETGESTVLGAYYKIFNACLTYYKKVNGSDSILKVVDVNVNLEELKPFFKDDINVNGLPLDEYNRVDIYVNEGEPLSVLLNASCKIFGDEITYKWNLYNFDEENVAIAVDKKSIIIKEVDAGTKTAYCEITNSKGETEELVIQIHGVKEGDEVTKYQSMVPEKVYYSESSADRNITDEDIKNEVKGHEAGWPVLIMATAPEASFKDHGSAYELTSVTYTLKQGSNTIAENVVKSKAELTALRCYTTGGVENEEKVIHLGANLGFYDLTPGEKYTVTATMKVRSWGANQTDIVYAIDVEGDFVPQPVDSIGNRYVNEQFIMAGEPSTNFWTYGYRKNKGAKLVGAQIWGIKDDKYTTILEGQLSDVEDDQYRTSDGRYGWYGSDYVSAADLVEMEGYRSTCYAKYSNLSVLNSFVGAKLDQVLIFDDGTTYTEKNSVMVIPEGAKLSNGVYMTMPVHNKPFDSTGNYVSIMVYGDRLDKTSVPAFYKQEDYAESSKVAVFDATDEKCAVTYDQGLTFISLKKTNPNEVFWKSFDYTTLYIKYNDDVYTTSQWANNFEYYYQPIWKVEYSDSGLDFIFGEGTNPKSSYTVKAGGATQTLSVSDKKMSAGKGTLYNVLKSSKEPVLFIAKSGSEEFYFEVNPKWKKGNSIELSVVDGKDVIFCGNENNKTTVVATLDGAPTFVNSAVTFTSSNQNVATVVKDSTNPKKAIVTAVSPGYTVITAKAGTVSKTVEIYVDKFTPPTGVLLKVKKLEMSVWDGERYLPYSILPLDANFKDQNISYTSSKPEVATVIKASEAEGEDEYNFGGLVRPVGPGTTTITIKAVVDGKEFTDTCEVTVRGEYTDAEWDALYDSGLYDMKYFMAKEGAKLSKIDLSPYVKKAGISNVAVNWKDPNTKLVADKTMPIQYFEAVLTRQGYFDVPVTIPVAVTEITGMNLEVDGNKIPGGGNVGTDVHVSFKYKGYAPAPWELIEGCYPDINAATLNDTIRMSCPEAIFNNWVYSYKDDQNNVVNVLDPFNYYVVSSTVEKDTDKTITASYVVGDKELFKAPAKKIKVTADDFVCEVELKDGTGHAYDAEKNVYSVDYAKDLPPVELTARVMYQMYWVDYDSEPEKIAESIAAREAGITADTNTFFKEKGNKLQWTTSDKNVIEVKADAADSAKAVVTIKAAGIATLSVKAMDTGAHVQNFVFDIKDYTPVLEAKTVSLKRYAQPVELGLTASYDNAIKAVEIEGNDFAKAALETKAINGVWTVNYKATDFDKSKNATMKANLKVTTNKGEPTVFEGVTFKVANNEPTLKAKQTVKANVFYKNSESVVSLSSANAQIKNVTLKESALYTVTGGAISSEIKVIPKDSSKNNWTDLKKTQPVKVTVTYDVDGVPVLKDETIKVSSVVKAPALKVNEAKVFPTRLTALVSITNTTDKSNLYLDDSYKVELVGTNPTVTLGQKSNGKLNVTLKDSKKSSASYTLSITNDNWNDAIKANGKLSKTTNQELVLSKTKITINSDHDSASYNSVEVPFSLKNSNAAIRFDRGIDISAVDLKTAKAVGAGYIMIHAGGMEERYGLYVNIGKNENDKFNEFLNGTYKFKITLEDVYGIKTKPVTFTVATTTKKPKATLKSSGKIDLAKRDTSFITVTGAITGETDQVQWMYVDGDNNFGSEFDPATGKMTVHAYERANIKANTNYKVPVVVDTALGETYKTELIIKPSYTKPKVKSNVATVTLYRSAIGGIKKTVNVSATGGQVDSVYISSSSFANNYLDIADRNWETDDMSTVSFALNDYAKNLKKGSYTITLDVYLSGTPINVADHQTVKVKVVVK